MQRTSVRAVFVGDSLTQRFQTEGRQYWKKYFMPYDPVNIGVAGDSTDQTISRLNDGVLGDLKSAKLSVLLIGTNDIGRGKNETYIASRTLEIIQILQSKLPGVSILLLGIIPRVSLSAMPGKINKLISEFDNGDSIRFLDMTKQFCINGKPNSRLYWDDRLHLSSEGYRVCSETMYPLFKEIRLMLITHCPL